MGVYLMHSTNYGTQCLTSSGRFLLPSDGEGHVSFVFAFPLAISEALGTTGTSTTGAGAVPDPPGADGDSGGVGM
jgi:hypothetical protein